MEEGIKYTVATLEREVIEYFMRRDNKCAKQLERIRKPEFAISPHTTTTSPVPPTSTPGFPLTNVPNASTTSQIHLPFSREGLPSTQADDDTLQGLTFSPSTPLTNGILLAGPTRIAVSMDPEGQGQLQDTAHCPEVPDATNHTALPSEDPG